MKKLKQAVPWNWGGSKLLDGMPIDFEFIGFNEDLAVIHFKTPLGEQCVSADVWQKDKDRCIALMVGPKGKTKVPAHTITFCYPGTDPTKG